MLNRRGMDPVTSTGFARDQHTLDDAHDLGDGFRRLCQLLSDGIGRIAALAVEPIGLLGVGAHRFGGDCGRAQ